MDKPKLTKTYWIARWTEDLEDKETAFEGPNMEAKCRLFAQSKTLELQKEYQSWRLENSQDYKTKVKVTEVTVYEEDLDSYTYEGVMQDMVKPRDRPMDLTPIMPTLVPEEPPSRPAPSDLEDEIPF